MSDLAISLSTEVNRVVLDRTGLTGQFDYQLDWTPDQMPFGFPREALFGAPPAQSPGSIAGPSIFTAVQEQLGLKLESTRGPVDILIIDRAERPTAD